MNNKVIHNVHFFKIALHILFCKIHAKKMSTTNS